MRFREKEVLKAWSKSILSLTFLRAHWGSCFGVTATLLNSFAADPRRAENKESMLVSTIVSKNCYDTQMFIDAHSVSGSMHLTLSFLFIFFRLHASHPQLLFIFTAVSDESWGCESLGNTIGMTMHPNLCSSYSYFLVHNLYARYQTLKVCVHNYI